MENGMQKKNPVKFSSEELPSDYQKTYILDFILTEKLSYNQKKEAEQDLMELLNLTSIRTIQRYRKYTGSQDKGRIPEDKQALIEAYFDLVKGSLLVSVKEQELLAA